MNPLEDKEAIRELLARYCFLLDGYRLDQFAALFTADGEWTSRNGTAKGPADIERLLRGMVPEPAPGRRRKHFTANIIVDLAGDSATVISNSIPPALRTTEILGRLDLCAGRPNRAESASTSR